MSVAFRPITEEAMRAPGLKGQVAVVTGGAGADGGLGLTATEVLCRAGAKVAVWDRNEKASDAARRELASLGLEPRFYTVDVTDRRQIEEAHRKVREELGPVDTLVNNAALKMEVMLGPRSERQPGTVPFFNLDPDRFRSLLEVNVLGPFLTSSELVPSMAERGRGSVINVVTSPHTMRSPNHIPYGPSKAALEAMTRCMAAQLAGSGVRFNAILPGGSANRRGEADPALSPFDTMAAPILWLASDDSKAVTGEVIPGTEFSLPYVAR